MEKKDFKTRLAFLKEAVDQSIDQDLMNMIVNAYYDYYAPETTGADRECADITDLIDMLDSLLIELQNIEEL